MVTITEFYPTLCEPHCPDLRMRLPAFVAGQAARRAPSGKATLLLVAPEDAAVPNEFRRIQFDRQNHESLISRMQKLRGEVYLADGAIESGDLTADGRHHLAIDNESWHLLAMEPDGSVCGCVRYRNHPNTADFDAMWVRHSALAKSPEGGPKLRRAVEAELRMARGRQVSYVEVGGWAIGAEYRCTTEALRIALATFALAQALGGCIGLTTATVRHSSSSILRRIGGASLDCGGQILGPYYDPQYRCEMEVLRFDSARPAAKYAPWIDQIRAEMRDIPVICRTWPKVLWSPARLDHAVHYQQPLSLPCPA